MLHKPGSVVCDAAIAMGPLISMGMLGSQQSRAQWQHLPPRDNGDTEASQMTR